MTLVPKWPVDPHHLYKSCQFVSVAASSNQTVAPAGGPRHNSEKRSWSLASNLFFIN